MTHVIVFAAVAQRLVLALFVVLGVRALKRSRPASHP